MEQLREYLPVPSSFCINGLFLVQDRLQNYYGAYGARLTRKQSVLATQPENTSKFMQLLSPVLFFIPHAQLERVEPLVIDRHVISIHWKRFFSELQEEWIQTMTLVSYLRFWAQPRLNIQGHDHVGGELCFLGHSFIPGR
jgi:hypothetical protein